MFNKTVQKERIGDIDKSATLFHLKEVEKYFLQATKKYKIEIAYDVVANEIPYFKTLNYTEWGHCFITHPLQQEFRVQQMRDAYNDNAEVVVNYVEYFKNKVLDGKSNKYSHIDKTAPVEYRDNLVVLVGSDKLKERICLNKLKKIANEFEDEVFFKPHPFTKYQIVGELMDELGKDRVLDRDADMYQYMLKAETVFTSHLSESAVYAVCLDKQIEPIDVYHKTEQGSFYHINKFLFTEDDPKAWINRTFNSAKCGIINPSIDSKWKIKIDEYLDYIMSARDRYKNKYI